MRPFHVLILSYVWRRGRDSNSRDPCRPSGFQDRCTQPLCDLSAITSVGRNQYPKRGPPGLRPLQNIKTVSKIRELINCSHCFDKVFLIRCGSSMSHFVRFNGHFGTKIYEVNFWRGYGRGRKTCCKKN